MKRWSGWKLDKHRNSLGPCLKLVTMQSLNDAIAVTDIPVASNMVPIKTRADYILPYVRLACSAQELLHQRYLLHVWYMAVHIRSIMSGNLGYDIPNFDYRAQSLG